MAYLVKRKGSPYWHLRFVDARSGRWTQHSTKLSITNRIQTRQAKNLRDQYAIKERGSAFDTPAAAWSCWVPEYLHLRWGGTQSENTRIRYQSIWRNWNEFLERNNLKFPRQLRREDVIEFFKWRQAEPDGPLRRCGRNTALLEVKIFGIWVDEAIRRGYCEQNPCRHLGWSKDRPPDKPDINDDDIALITRELEREPEWMKVSFLISIYHGVRLKATQVNLDADVDWDRMTVTFHEKGGYTYAVPLHPALVPIFQRLKNAGNTMACALPKNASKKWMLFFKRINRPQYCFHCCRVTVITKLARRNVPENLAMKFVGHRSAEIHRVYQKLRADDLRLCHLDIQFSPCAPDPAAPKLTEQPSPTLQSD